MLKAGPLSRYQVLKKKKKTQGENLIKYKHSTQKWVNQATIKIRVNKIKMFGPPLSNPISTRGQHHILVWVRDEDSGETDLPASRADGVPHSSR